MENNEHPSVNEDVDLHDNQLSVSKLKLQKKNKQNDPTDEHRKQKDKQKQLIRSLFTPKRTTNELPSIEVIPTTYKSKKARKFYQPGLIVQVDNRTIDAELQRLFHVGVRTLFVRMGYAMPDELNQMMILIQEAIRTFHKNKPYLTPIGIAIELRGQSLRTGRVRNDKPLAIEQYSLLVLTCNKKYQYVSQKEIVYVSNLSKYVSLVQVGDTISMNRNKIQLRVVKVLNNNITCCIEMGTSIRSYMDVDLPYYVANDFEQTPEDIDDVQFAIDNDVQFIVVPGVPNVQYIKKFRTFLAAFPCDCDIMANIELCIATHRCIAKEIIAGCDGIWLNKIFKRMADGQFNVDDTTRCIIKLAEDLQIPVIGKIPIKIRPDFMKLKNNEILKYLDAIVIEKSPKTQTFPLIARKLFCVQCERTDSLAFPSYTDNAQQEIGEKMPEPIDFHINIQKCVAVIINATISHNTAKLLSRKRVYCPIIVVAANEVVGKRLNIYRNLKVVVFTDPVDDENSRLAFGINYGVWSKILNVGDFIISFYDKIYYECITSQYRTLYVPEQNIRVPSYLRTNFT